MKKLAIILAIVLVLTTVFFVMASGFKKYDISLGLEQGQVLKLRSAVSMKMNQEMEGEKMEVVSTAEVVYRFEVESVEDGVYTLALSYEDVSFEGTVTVPTSDQPITQKVDDSFKSIFNDITVKVLVDSRGEIQGLKDFDQLASYFKEIATKNGVDEMQAQMNYSMLMSILSEENLKTSWDSMFAYIPATPVKVGESWTIDYSMTQPYPMDMPITYTLKDVTKDAMLVDLTGTIDMDETVQQQGIDLKVKLTGEFSGQINVNRSNGWLNSMTHEQSFSGTMSTALPGYGEMEIPVTMSSVINVTSE